MTAFWTEGRVRLQGIMIFGLEEPEMSPHAPFWKVFMIFIKDPNTRIKIN